MPFRPGNPEPPVLATDLIARGIPRDRALCAEAVSGRRWRQEAGPITRNQLAERAGMNVRQVRKLEAGDLDPQFFSTVVRLAHALGVHSLDEMVGFLPLEDLRP